MRFDSRSRCVEIQFLIHVEKFLISVELDPAKFSRRARQQISKLIVSKLL